MVNLAFSAVYEIARPTNATSSARQINVSVSRIISPIKNRFIIALFIATARVLLHRLGVLTVSLPKSFITFATPLTMYLSIERSFSVFWNPSKVRDRATTLLRHHHVYTNLMIIYMARTYISQYKSNTGNINSTLNTYISRRNLLCLFRKWTSWRSSTNLCYYYFLLCLLFNSIFQVASDLVQRC